MFSIKHIPREENNQANQLAQQALSYVVSQGIFWVASIGLVEHRYGLRSKGKSSVVQMEMSSPSIATGTSLCVG
jgi:hypothetical protein